MLAELEKDLEGIVKAIEQGFANVNVLQGQRQGLEHAIKAIKAAASATETIVNAVEAVIEPTTTQGE